MNPQINILIAAERRADADRGTSRLPRRRRLTLSALRLTPTPAALECCA